LTPALHLEEDRAVSRIGMAAGLVLAALVATDARAADGTVTLNSGSVAAGATATVRCDDPLDGKVANPVDGDELPGAASATADVSVPCQHAGAPDTHAARGDASASGTVSSGPNGTVISGSGTVSATGFHFVEASATAELTQEFTVEGGPIDYRLTIAGRGGLDGANGDAAGVLQPGGHVLRAQGDCSAGVGLRCEGFEVTLELGVPEDTDGDALFDSWEEDGIDADGDGTPELDLPAMGADPRHKDIFLEIDHMPGHAIAQSAVDRLVAAFAASPVANPDGRGGINLHVDNGPASRMDQETGAAWGALSDADQLPHQTVLGTRVGSTYDWSAFDALKAGHFQPARADAFHYLISAHRHGSATNSSSGISRELGASDLIVSLGAAHEPAESSGTTAEQAGTVMHELGHNLGLRHGGDDDGNYEPNRLSIMNYAFQFTGIPRLDGTDVLDYSRLAIDLDERALNEDEGFGFAAGTTPAEWLTIYRCPDRTRRWAYLQASATDWNCDGTEQGLVARDLNGDAVRTALAPFVDWSNLVFHGGAIGGAGEALPVETPMIEPPVEELQENAAEVAKAHVEASATPTPDPGGDPGGGVPGGGAGGGGGDPGSGGPAGGGATDEPPVLTGLAISPSAFPAARRGASTGRKGPAALRFRASRAGHVRFRVLRERPGRRSGRRCVAPRRGARGRRCKRLVAMRGAFVLPAAAGANATRVSGRLRGRALATGRYVLVATPLSAQLRRPGAARRAPFRIVSRRRR
jgi:hypothetical protein